MTFVEVDGFQVGAQVIPEGLFGQKPALWYSVEMLEIPSENAC